MAPALKRPMGICLVAIATVLLIALGGARTTAKAPLPQGVVLYPDASNTHLIDGVFKKCHGAFLRKGKLELSATSTNGNWELSVEIRRWKGLGHRHVLHYGSTRPGFVEVDSHTSNRNYNTAFPPASPVPTPAGSVTFNRSGTRVTVDAAPGNVGYSDAILVHGTMSCSAPG
jgi:hypothetical protein